MSTESKLASKSSDLMFAVSEMVNATAGTWQEKRDAVVESARYDDLLDNLNEFLSWFGANKVK